jgi:hypothetical protein
MGGTIVLLVILCTVLLSPDRGVAMARGEALVAQGKRKNGRWERGSITNVIDNQNYWAGYILDHDREAAEVNSFAFTSRAASSSVSLALAPPVTHPHSTPPRGDMPGRWGAPNLFELER